MFFREGLAVGDHRYLRSMPETSTAFSNPHRLLPRIIGHRGAPGYRPEHTASSYRLALQQGADAVEPDVVASKDGVLVVRHENEISGTTDVSDHPEFADRRCTKTVDGVQLTGWFTEDFTWAELSTLRSRERIPNIRPANTLFDGAEGLLRLTDVLSILDEQAAPGETDLAQQSGIVIEIKHAHYFMQHGFDLAALVARDLRAAGWFTQPERIVCESFEMGVLDRLRELSVPGMRVFLTETAGLPADEVDLPKAVAHTWEWYRSDEGLQTLLGRVHGISVAKSDLFVRGGTGTDPRTNDFVFRAHAREMLVFVWTLRPENKFLLPAFRSSGGSSEPGDWRAEWEMILATGVDGVFVDHPDLVRRL